MQYKPFGTRTGAHVSELALGAGMLGNRSGHGAAPDEAKRILQIFAEAGGTVLDLSDAYQLGQSEELVGKFIANKRDEYFLVSKYARTSQANPSLSAYGGNRKAMSTAVESSLKRLNTDHIDLYMPHFDDGVTPIDEIMRGFEDLARAGKILYAGFSNSPAWRIATAAVMADERSWTPVTAIEVEYNLLQRTTERDILPMAGEFGLGVLAYSPLARGVLVRRGDEATNGNAQQLKVLNVVDSIANECGQSAAAVAIAWLKYKGVIPILGASSAQQMASNLKAAEFDLTAEQVRRLDDAGETGGGYPHDLLKLQSARWPRDAHPRG